MIAFAALAENEFRTVGGRKSSHKRIYPNVLITLFVVYKILRHSSSVVRFSAYIHIYSWLELCSGLRFFYENNARAPLLIVMSAPEIHDTERTIGPIKRKNNFLEKGILAD